MKIGYLLFGDNTKVNYNGILDRFNMSTEDVMKLSGGNLGNLAFKYGAMGLLSDTHEIIYITYSSDIEFVKNNVDLIILPEANLINDSIDYTHPAKFIKSVDKPCLLLGVGAQAVDMDSSVNLQPGTLEYLIEVSKRTSNILVRGEFTKSKLLDLGIKNVISTGCPSLMINPSKFLWRKIKENLNKVVDFNNIAITEGVYPVSKRSTNLDLLESRLFERVMSGSADYVGQVQTSVISCGLNNKSCISRDDLYYLRSYLSPASSEIAFKKISSERFKAFTKLDEWLMYYKSKESVIGTRIHGNFIAIQAEVPAIPIVHDSRTEELCKTMSIPYLQLNTAKDICTKSDLFDAYNIIRNADSNTLDGHRAMLAQKYISELQEMGITPSKKLKHIGSY